MTRTSGLIVLASFFHSIDAATNQFLYWLHVDEQFAKSFIPIQSRLYTCLPSNFNKRRSQHQHHSWILQKRFFSDKSNVLSFNSGFQRPAANDIWDLFLWRGRYLLIEQFVEIFTRRLILYLAKFYHDVIPSAWYIEFYSLLVVLLYV